MPPRHTYWTILVDDQPTAFRAHEAEELLPTLNRLREKNRSAVMKWFERGQLFDSRDAAREAGLGRSERRWEGPRPDRSEAAFRREDKPRESRARERDHRREDEDRPRDKNWRPGGEHRDPRQKYRDAKKAKWNRFKQKIRARHERHIAGRDESRPQRSREPFPAPKYSPPHGDPLRGRKGDRDRFDTPYEDRQGRPSRPHGDRMPFRPKAAAGHRKPFASGRGKPSGGSRSNWRPQRDHDRPRRRRGDEEE